jgi:riboflavin synthase
MFTGLVEIVGKIIDTQVLDMTEDGGQGMSLTVGEATEILDDCKLGDSIAINGTCLTVTHFTKDTFKVNLAPETLRKTNLGELKVGSPVNLERATASHTRFGGHFVQGHVDTTVTIIEITPEDNSTWYKFKVEDSENMKYIIEKGFIALDGTSLTVCDVDDKDNWFTIMMIPFTKDHVIMPTKKVGDKVNVEMDMLGKYVNKVIGNFLEGSSSREGGPIEALVERIIEKKLKERNL